MAVDGHLPADTTTVQFYRWYATGEDIPFAVQVRREGYSECLFMISEITEKLTDSDDDDYGGDDAAKVRELLDNIKVSVGHDTVSISLGQFDGSCAEAYLVDIPGNIHGCTSSRLDEQENIIDIPLYGLPAGLICLWLLLMIILNLYINKYLAYEGGDILTFNRTAGSAMSAADNYVTPVRSDIIPPAPTAATVVEQQMPRPSLLTGAVDFALPLLYC